MWVTQDVLDVGHVKKEYSQKIQNVYEHYDAQNNKRKMLE